MTVCVSDLLSESSGRCSSVWVPVVMEDRVVSVVIVVEGCVCREVSG